MNNKDLMIGDWVLCVGIPIKLNIGQIHNLVCDTEWARTYKCEPVPLTEEILKANGFEKRPESYYNSLSPSYNKDGFALSICVKKDYFYIYCAMISIQIKYVHEIQHALRLCGLNELADNFKVD